MSLILKVARPRRVGRGHPTSMSMVVIQGSFCGRGEAITASSLSEVPVVDSDA